MVYSSKTAERIKWTRLLTNCDISFCVLFLQVDWNQRGRPTSNQKLEPLQANRKNRQDSSLPTVRFNGFALFGPFSPKQMMNHVHFPHISDCNIQHHKVPSISDSKISDWISFYFLFKITISQSDPAEWQGFYDRTQNVFMGVLLRHWNRPFAL